MNKHDQNGSINSLLLPLITVSILFAATAGFAFWAFNERQAYKFKVDEKIAAAVKLARQDESTKKDKQFVEAEKNPFRTYSGPQAFGSLKLDYPKTWSAYVDDSGRSNAEVDGYFHPGTVPAVSNPNSTFALRVKVVAQSYATILAGLRSSEKSGAVSIAPYALPNVPDVIGVKVTGEIRKDKNGVMIILPLRDKSIQISTEGNEYGGDFENNILPNLTFSP